MNVKIFNITHKTCRLFDSSCVKTINAGRSVLLKKSKDGILSSADVDWMLKNTLSDAEGDNISNLNRFYNEMTVIYWVWKNYEKIGNPDAVGFMHYRRHFILNDSLKFTGNYDEDIGLTESILSSVLSSYDLVHPKFLSNQKKIIDDIGEGLCSLGGDTVKKAIQIVLDLIKERNHEEYEKVFDVLNSFNTGSLCNMFIMKKSLFFDYCNWIFPLLFGLDKDLGRNYKTGEERTVGWIAEILTSIYIFIKSKEVSHKQVSVFEKSEIKELPLYPESRLMNTR